MPHPSPPEHAALKAMLQRGFRYALALTHDSAEAEDLVQEAWLRCRRKGKDLAPSYLIATIRNRWIDTRRRGAVVAMVPLGDLEPGSARSRADGRMAAKDEVAQALGSLSDVEREALFLHAAEGWTAEEIARLTQKSRNTVLTILARARRKLAAWRAAQQREVS